MVNDHRCSVKIILRYAYDLSVSGCNDHLALLGKDIHAVMRAPVGHSDVIAERLDAVAALDLAGNRPAPCHLFGPHIVLSERSGRNDVVLARSIHRLRLFGAHGRLGARFRALGLPRGAYARIKADAGVIRALNKAVSRYSYHDHT